LARWQARWVADRLETLGGAVELVQVTTHGDVESARSIGRMETRGIFTKAIQDALMADRIDVAVHSLKDLPTDPVEGLSLTAFPEREVTTDALLDRTGKQLETLPAGTMVGTGSLRRRAQLLYVRPDLKVTDIRGNVGTRIEKLDRGDYGALVLAAAGLIRLGLSERITEILGPPRFLPAVGQGALAVEVRSDDMATRRMVSQLDHAPTRFSVLAERALLASLRGGCLAPVGAWGRVEEGLLSLSAVVLDRNGTRRLEQHDSSPPEEFEQLGRRVAEALLAHGAAELIASSRAEPPEEV
jgi:hydroxymethylbilane synthase